MTRTYYIVFKNALGEMVSEKITHKSPEDRPRWHKVEALSKWKETHKGYGYLRINHVFTRAELSAWNGEF